MHRRGSLSCTVEEAHALTLSAFLAALLILYLGVALLGPVFPADQPGPDEKAKAVHRADPKPTLEAKSTSVPVAVPTLAGDLYALVVGVAKYKSPEVPPLAVSDKDARDFAAFLESQKGLYRQAYIKVLVNEEATKFEIEKQLYHELKKAGASDTVVLFFSGHGTVDPTQPGEFFFLSYDAQPDYLAASGVNMSGLKFMKAFDCPRVLLIADACNAGGFSRVRTKMSVTPFKTFVREFTASTGRVILTSSRPEEYSLEKANLGNSVFTYYLLDGLSGAADKDGNGVITIDEAYRYVYDRTKDDSRGAQHPQFEGTVEGTFPVAVSRSMEARPVTTLEILATVPDADVEVGDSVVGRTDSRGALLLKYLPLDVAIPVRIRKKGWKEVALGPFVFTSEKAHITASGIRLHPSLTSLELQTVPGKVNVSVEGVEKGVTGNDGKLVLRDLQVEVPQRLELRKQGFQTEVLTVTIPSSYEGKLFHQEKVTLAKGSAPAETRAKSAEPSESATNVTRSVPSPSEPDLTSSGLSRDTGSGVSESRGRNFKYMHLDHE